MLDRFRTGWRKIMTPPAKLLLRLGLSPDVITWLGTIGTVVVALSFFPRGWLWQGPLVMLLFIFSDSLDGTMARLSGRQSNWGAFLDATLDRVADGAVFGGLALYYAGPGNSQLWAGLSIAALVLGQVTSYSKARGEAEGFTVDVGLVGRADRLLIVLVGALLTGLGLDWALKVTMGYLVVGGAITVGQRIATVHKQAHTAEEPRG